MVHLVRESQKKRDASYEVTKSSVTVQGRDKVETDFSGEDIKGDFEAKV